MNVMTTVSNCRIVFIRIKSFNLLTATTVVYPTAVIKIFIISWLPSPVNLHLHSPNRQSCLKLFYVCTAFTCSVGKLFFYIQHSYGYRSKGMQGKIHSFCLCYHFIIILPNLYISPTEICSAKQLYIVSKKNICVSVFRYYLREEKNNVFFFI